MIKLERYNAGQIDVDLLQTIAHDHSNIPDHSICRYANPICTNSAFIAQTPSTPWRVWILTGTPGENKYISYKVP